MSLASLRKLRVGIYTYDQQTDAATGVTRSLYMFAPSPDSDGLWWASRGTTFGRETAPAQQPQEEQTAFFSLSAYAPVTPDGLLTVGEAVYRIQSVMARDYYRDAVQIFTTMVDDANLAYSLVSSDLGAILLENGDSLLLEDGTPLIAE